MGCSAGKPRHIAARRGTFHGAPKNNVPLHIVKQTKPRHVQKQRSGQTPRRIAARCCFRRGFCASATKSNRKKAGSDFRQGPLAGLWGEPLETQDTTKRHGEKNGCEPMEAKRRAFKNCVADRVGQFAGGGIPAASLVGPAKADGALSLHSASSLRRQPSPHRARAALRPTHATGAFCFDLLRPACVVASWRTRAAL